MEMRRFFATTFKGLEEVLAGEIAALGGEAVSIAAWSADTVNRELAAYEVDRLLGLGLVPATAARNHDGTDGVLQGRPLNYVSEKDRQGARNGSKEGLVCQTISVAPQAVPARRPTPKETVARPACRRGDGATSVRRSSSPTRSTR